MPLWVLVWPSKLPIQYNLIRSRPFSVEITVAVIPTEFTDENGETVRFDPTEEAVRYRFGEPAVVEDGGGARPAHDGHDGSDTDGDALVLHFPMEETGFDEDSTEGRLIWERDESGEHGYSGTDEVTVTGGGSGK